MRFAYADPPYYGCAAKHYADHPEHAVYDTKAGHQQLVLYLTAEYPNGWALSMTSGSLLALVPHLPLPDDCRVAAWVKPFASFKPGVNPAYCWEPVIWRSERKRERDEPTVRDFLAENITLRRGLAGAKPDAFNRWILDLLGCRDGDTLDDLFPGTSGMATARDQLTISPGSGGIR